MGSGDIGDEKSDLVERWIMSGTEILAVCQAGSLWGLSCQELGMLIPVQSAVMGLKR